MDRQDWHTFIATSALAAAGIAALAWAGVSEARAHNIACAPADRITQWLADNYREAPIATGQAGQRTLVQLWLSEDGATFTIVTINTAGVACMLASGDHWTEQEFVAPELGEES
ncbi:MAG: hypothetical protein JJ864_08590 [Rhizobiaceae bacterium]|nr:hypothetical protein [Rhizobiaceae bacterium]